MRHARDHGLCPGAVVCSLGQRRHLAKGPGELGQRLVEALGLTLLVAHEPGEPPHVHVDRDKCSAKLWLEPLEVAANLGFSARELRRIEGIVAENWNTLRKAWRDNFGT